ncbi:MAG TPA: hypothetical protein VFC41_09980 [Anaerovoracaceae bacterium]|nr:hypothetical protein [Anaerovoracaceae bacterium]
MDKKIDAQAFETYLQKVLKLTAEEVASLYNEAGELTDFTLVEQKDAARITKLSSDKTNQYNRGLKEGAEKLEKAIKEKYEVESDFIGLELFDHVIETKVSEVGSANPEEVMKHPEVIKALNEKDKALRAKDKEWQSKIADKEKEINKSNLFNKVKAKAIAEFENLKPILPENANKAQALKDVLLSELVKFNYQEDGENFIILKEDGTPLKNEHGYDVTFQDHIKGHAEKYFDFKTAEERSSSANNNSSTAGPKVKVPKTKDEYVTMMRDQTLTPQQRVEIKNLAVKAGVA